MPVSTRGERIRVFDNYNTLPNTVRSLPYIVRLPRQRSTRLSYQDTDENSVNDDDFWIKYQEYLLKTYNKHTAKVRLLYSKKYYHVLTEANAQELLMLSNDKRITLEGILGCYYRWNSVCIIKSMTVDRTKWHRSKSKEREFSQC